MQTLWTARTVDQLLSFNSKLLTLILERRHINHEAITYVAFLHPFISFVDFLDGDHFDVGGDAVLVAEIEHLLRFLDASDGGAGQAATASQQGHGSYGNFLFRNAHQDHGAVELEQSEIFVPVDFSGNGVDDEIEVSGELCESFRIGRGIKVVRAQTLAIAFLFEGL